MNLPEEFHEQHGLFEREFGEDRLASLEFDRQIESRPGHEVDRNRRLREFVEPLDLEADRAAVEFAAVRLHRPDRDHALIRGFRMAERIGADSVRGVDLSVVPIFHKFGTDHRGPPARRDVHPHGRNHARQGRSALRAAAADPAGDPRGTQTRDHRAVHREDRRRGHRGIRRRLPGTA